MFKIKKKLLMGAYHKDNSLSSRSFVFKDRDKLEISAKANYS